jgi:hypothetical protein
MDKTRIIDNTPSWEWSVRIFIAVLENKKASAEGKQSAREELLRLARIVDHSNKKK